MIRLENLTKKFRTDDVETAALHVVNINIQAGEFVAVMGPSGCGKSTLLNIVGLLDNPDDGQYYFFDQEISTYPEPRLAELRKGNIGFVFQSFNLIDDLTVEENVELPLVYQSLNRATRRSMVREVLELVGLNPRARHLPGQLSGGQQQRVAIARAVVSNPKLILADEPTGNLDSRNGNEVMEMLEILNNEGTTILMVTHSPSHAGRAKRTIHMKDGRVVSNDEVEI